METILMNAPHAPSKHLDDISCDQTTTNPSYPDGCNIYCSASSSCGALTDINAPDIICPPITGSKCIIHCEGDTSCKHANIIYNTNTIIPNLTIVLLCSGADSCQNVTINAPEQSNVTVICDGTQNECSSLEINAGTANFVSIKCDKALCNHMDIYCPKFSNNLGITNNKNCIIDCSKANNCNDNNIYIKENNLDNDYNIGLSYKCSTAINLCNSYINCDYDNGKYKQECKWYKSNNQWNCGSNDECHGGLTIGFLSGWKSVSTLIFVIMMAFGFTVVLGILIYTIKEKYDEFSEKKEKYRKNEKRTTTKKRTMQRRGTLMNFQNNNNNNHTNNKGNRIYGKKHKFSGSYYRAPKNNKLKSTSSTDQYGNTIDEKTEYQYDSSNKPSHIQIIEEYNDDDEEGMVYINHQNIEEEEAEQSESLHSEHSESYSQKSSKSTKPKSIYRASKTKPKLMSKSKSAGVKKVKKKGTKPRKNSAKKSQSGQGKGKAKGKKKSAKKKKKLHTDTPVKSSKKMDNDPPPLTFQSFAEDKENDGMNKNTVSINVKTKKKKFGIDSFRKKRKTDDRSDEIKYDEYPDDDDESDTSNASKSSIKSKSKGSKKRKGSNKKSSVEMSTKSPKQKRSVRFQSDSINKQKQKKDSKKKKARSKSRPLNVIDESNDMPKKKNTSLMKSRSVELKKGKKGKKGKNVRKRRKDKDRKKSAPVNKIKKSGKGGDTHKKTNSLISLGGMFKNKNGDNENEKAGHDSEDDGSTTSSMKYFNMFKKNKNEEEKRQQPALKREKSSPLYKNLKNITFSDFIWESFYASQVYGGALFHAWDIATDFGVIFNWIENDENYLLIAFSLIAIFFYRFLSAIVLARQFGWQWGIIQFLDLTIYIEAYRSLKNKYCQYTRELKWIRRMEAIFESTPQALLQLGFLLKSPSFGTYEEIQPFDILIIVSFISSLLSIAFSVARDDEVHFEMDAWPFLIPYFKSEEKRDKWYKKNKKKLERKENTKKSQSYVKERKKKEKQKLNNVTPSKRMVAMYELESCYLEPDDYVNDAVNTIWLPNWKYMVRFTFRFTEATARILTLALIWVAFGGLYLLIWLGVGLLFYLGLQITGIIGYEWGNMWTFIIVHPNLTLKTDFEKSDRPKLLFFVTMISGWYLLHKIFKFDMVETHFLHRFVETLSELIIISVSIYVLKCCGIEEYNDDYNTYYNTKKIFFTIFGYGIVALAYFCTIVTPILYKFIVRKWIKKSTSLENNLFGLIRLFDVSPVQTFLKKSNRSDQLINSVSAQGYTPLSLACEIGFYDVFEILLEYGANVNEQNRRGETAVFVFAKQRTLSKFMYKGLNRLKKIDADFSIVDHQGWSPAFHACEAGNIKFIDWLCKNDMGNALQAKDFDSRSISHIAALHNQSRLLEQLNKLKKKGKLKSNLLLEKDEDGRIPLHYAFEHQSANAVKYLIENNRISAKIEDINGDTPLMFGARFGEVAFFQKLKSLKYKTYRQFLVPVSIDGEYDTLKWLLRECQGSSGKFKPLEKFMDKESKRTPLHYACMHGSDKLIPLLHKYKFNVNDTDYKHRTPAFFAAQRGHLKCLKALHKLGASFKIENTKRNSPYQIAEENNHYKCVAFLYDKK